MLNLDIILSIGAIGNQALDQAEADLQKANQILKGLGGN